MSDQPARKQAVSDFNHTLLVEAGAGTGKTTLLVNRICALINSGVKADKIAAVTFTVKAAGELKQRLRDELKKCESANAKEALLALDRMTVNTIHGLAAEMLRTLPVEAKLPPEFQALDDLQQTAAIEEFRTNWLSRALDSDVPVAFELAEILGLDLLGSEHKGLAKLFDTLNRSLVDLDRISTGKNSGNALKNCRTAVIASVSELAHLALQCARTDDKLYEAIRNLTAEINQAPADLYTRDGINWLNSLKLGSQGDAKKWKSANALEQARAAKEHLAVSIAEAKQLITSYICLECARWMAPAILEFRQHLRERGTIGFDDLLILSRNTLRDSKVARDFFKSRYDYLHIDEFQDTDPIQAEILLYMAEEEKDFSRHWQTINLKPGKLFVVGDPKQSIYRFRGADVRIYNNIAQRIAETGVKLSISRNFRSRPTILSEVNAVFSPIMLGRSENEAQYEQLVPREGAEHDPQAVELLVPSPKYDRVALSASQSASREAAAIAEHISRLAASNKDFKFSHAAILLRAGTHENELQNALSARGIPFISFLNSAFTSRVEMEAILTLLHAIANPQHTVATIGALRSPLFAISDDEICEHKFGGHSLVYTDSQPQDNCICTALNELHNWHNRSKQITASALLEELLSVAPMEMFYGLKSEGVQRVQNIHTLIELVRRLEIGGARSLGEIVERVAEMTRLVQSTELEARDENRNAVQLLTLHKAKGLEFKVVYLYAYREKTKSSGEWMLLKSLNDEPHQLALSIDSKTGYVTSNWNEVNSQNSEAERAELQRLLYVGMTRAKDKLVLPLGWSRKSKGKPDPYIPAALLGRYPLTPELTPDISGTDAVLITSDAEVQSNFKPFSTQLESNGNIDAATRANFKAWQKRHKSRVTALRTTLPLVTTDEPAVDWRRVRARKIGTFVHSVLEHVASGKTSVNAGRLATRTTSLTEDESGEARSIIAQVLSSDLFTKELPTACRVITELPIIETQNNHVTAKFVDLMFETDEHEWILLDYKTDDISASAVEAHKEEHRAQLEDYAQMFARTTGHPPKELRLYFVRPNRLVKM